MRLVIQRVQEASVSVAGEVKGAIDKGLLILIGVEDADTQDDADWLVKKVVGLRIFDDENGIMNEDIRQTGGQILVISQFTLFASYKKGNRPSWFRASKGSYSEPLYSYFCRALSDALGQEVAQGVFGADMKVSLINDGPVTICMDTKNKE